MSEMRGNSHLLGGRLQCPLLPLPCQSCQHGALCYTGGSLVTLFVLVVFVFRALDTPWI